jgi:hypothetical protein
MTGELPAPIGTNLLIFEKYLTFRGHPERNEKPGGAFRLIKMIDNMIYQCAKVDL